MVFSIDLFSGLGGNAYAFAGFATPVLYCEVDGSAVNLLKMAMASGYIATAPVHGDVRTITKSPHYAQAKAQRPLMVTGSWPCQGNSTLGKRQGMDDPRSGLLRELCEVITDAEPEFFFTENVPAAASNGSYDHMRSVLEGAYDIACTYVMASDLGFAHERKRFFCLGVRRKGGAEALRSLRIEPLTRLLPAAVEPPRTVRLRPAGLYERLHALGNAVVPAASYYAFLTIADLPVEGLPDQPPQRPQLVFDPAAYTPPATVQVDPRRQTAEVLTEPKFASRWSTPRAGAATACHRLTTRAVRDLASQVRFERGTPDEARGWYINPDWVAHLMGFPAGYARHRRIGEAEAENKGGARL